MAELRLIALVLFAGAACRSSDAGPAPGSAAGSAARTSLTSLTSGITAPAGWHAMPEMARAASEVARGAKLRVEGAEAWGEPARGCYAAWIATGGAAGAPDVLADKMVASLSSAKGLPGISVTEVVTPAKNVGAGMLSLAFEAAGHHGRVEARIAKTGAIAVLACFWNPREPAACEAACKPLLEGFR